MVFISALVYLLRETHRLDDYKWGEDLPAVGARAVSAYSGREPSLGGQKLIRFGSNVIALLDLLKTFFSYSS